MDFHSLSRRELQSLCKNNKIPANMTNVAMADALKVLEHVEGLEDILNQPESNPLQSPENPRTARRKPSNAEHGSALSLTSARRTARRTAAEEVNGENKNVNVAGTPAVTTARRRATVRSARQQVGIHPEEADEVPEKRDVSETPAGQTSRQRAPATYSRWKKDEKKDEGSVQRVYSTRRSARLLEKSMSELSLKEQGRLKPIKMIEEEENEVKKESSETKLLEMSPDIAQETDGLQSSGQVSNDLLEDGRELFKDVIEDNKNNDSELDDDKAKQEVGYEKSDQLENPLVSTVQYQYESESSDKTEVLLKENVENTVDESDESIHEKGTDILAVRISSENENSNIVSKSETNGELKDSHEFSFSEISAEIDHVTDSHCSPQHEINDSKKAELLLSYEHSESKVVESQQLACGDHDVEPKYAIDEEPKAGESHQENDSGEVSKDNVPVLSKGIDSVEFKSDKGSERSDEVHQPVSESSNMNDFPDDSTIEDYAGSESSVDDLVQVADEFVEEALFLTENHTNGPDADVREKFNITSTLSDKPSVFDMHTSTTCPLVSEGEAAGTIAIPKMEEYDSGALFDKNVTQAEEFGITHENPPPSDNTPSRGTDLVQFAPHSLPGQFPRPNLFSTKRQTTFPMMQDSPNNKENTDFGCNSEIKKDETLKKNNVFYKGIGVIDEKELKRESMRTLKKMLKEKLNITESTKDKENVTKQEGKSRPALQKLPENCMPGCEPVEM